MLQKKVKKRAYLLLILLLASGLAVFLILQSLKKNILYFKSPTDIKISQDINYNKKIRVGGMVKKDSLSIKDEEIEFIITDFELHTKKIRIGGMVKKDSIEISNNKINFIITDFKNEINVIYSGAVPNLFSEEKGVVAEGKLQDKKFFIADRILAKHDENYMPPELEAIMKKNVK